MLEALTLNFPHYLLIILKLNFKMFVIFLVVDANKVNQKLSRVNKHQLCEMSVLKERVKILENQLKQARVYIDAHPNDIHETIESQKTQIQQLSGQLTEVVC
eukprot:GHVO01056124.1.p1 GENE.GHVO01056124.1~~GHVO01056124.1.p1  ORF type:complete len:102 (-),score=2.01 GHVO01056124.1:86-391(-)